MTKMFLINANEVRIVKRDYGEYNYAIYTDTGNFGVMMLWGIPILGTIITLVWGLAKNKKSGKTVFRGRGEIKCP